MLDTVVRRLGYDIVPRNYYSAVTPFDEIPPEAWARRSPLDGIHFDTSEQLEWARRELAPFIAEFPVEKPAGWQYLNNFYESVDAEVLYAVVRRRRPARVVELGSGYSSQVIAAACRVNAREAGAPAYDIYDPFPREGLTSDLHDVATVRQTRVQDLPDSVFAELAAGDILFVDTSHTVKLGGDVNRIVLEVLPRLAPGVMVHFHDILLPAEYHPHWVQQRMYWAEAYLVQAFLCLNPAFRIRFSAYGVFLDHWADLKALVPSLRERGPSGFWIERVEP